MLTGQVLLRVRDIIRQIYCEYEVDTLRGVLSLDHVHMFVSMALKITISDPARWIKGRSSDEAQREFYALFQMSGLCCRLLTIGLSDVNARVARSRSGQEWRSQTA